ncbi:MAG: LptF/LptG family permease [Bacteroidota bacterium]
MTILDRYIVRQFLMTFIFGLVAFLLIFLVVDLMEKLDDFIDARVGTPVIIEYYLNFMPEIIKLMMPVAMLLAALFVTGRLAQQNELAAMKSSGMSLYRFLLPFAAVALLVSLGGIYFNGWIVPFANQKKFAIERQHLQRVSSSTSRFNIYFQEGRTRLVSIGFYDNNSKLANRVTIQDYADTNLTMLVRRLDAQQMLWQSFDAEKRDTVEPGWVLINGTHRVFQTNGHTLEQFSRFPVGRLSLGPDDIEKKQRKPDEMDFGELREFIESQRRAGQDVSRWLVDYHSKIAFPFASLIVVLFGVPFSSNKRRSGVAVEFGISIAATFVYLSFMKTSQVFGYNGDLDPFLTAWLANILFLTAGLINLARVQK